MKTNNFIPKVEFRLAPIELETEMLLAFSKSNDRFVNVMYKAYPELKDIYNVSKNNAEAIPLIRKFIEGIIEKNKEALNKTIVAIQEDWEKVGNAFLAELSNHMETDWPRDKEVITGYISINPICPRFLDNYSFFVDYKKNLEQARETTAHEILHFLWFKKCKEVFPESQPNEFESPHLVWRLSEVMDPIILQCNPSIRELIKPTKWGYDSFVDLKIGDMGMTQYFAEEYMRHTKARMNFSELIRVLYGQAEKNREVLEKF